MTETTCFTYETSVTTPAGFVPVGEIKAGDQVLGVTSSGLLIFDRVRSVIKKTGTGNLYQILTDFDDIVATHDHPLHVASATDGVRALPVCGIKSLVEGWSGKWVDASELKVGDQLSIPAAKFTEDGSHVAVPTEVVVQSKTTVRGINKLSKKLDVFDLGMTECVGFLVGNERMLGGGR